MHCEKFGGRSEVGRGTDSEGFVSQAEGGGIFPGREPVVVGLCFRYHSDCTAENGWKQRATRGRKPMRRQF